MGPSPLPWGPNARFQQHCRARHFQLHANQDRLFQQAFTIPSEVCLDSTSPRALAHDWRQLFRTIEWHQASERRADMADLPAIDCTLLRLAYDPFSPRRLTC
eukprot:6459615-Amphidinium_carterae.1